MNQHKTFIFEFIQCRKEVVLKLRELAEALDTMQKHVNNSRIAFGVMGVVRYVGGTVSLIVGVGLALPTAGLSLIVPVAVFGMIGMGASIVKKVEETISDKKVDKALADDNAAYENIREVYKDIRNNKNKINNTAQVLISESNAESKSILSILLAVIATVPPDIYTIISHNGSIHEKSETLRAKASQLEKELDEIKKEFARTWLMEMA